jgi:hypothetical protein
MEAGPVIRELIRSLVDETKLDVSTDTVVIRDGAPLLRTRLRAAETAAAALGAEAAMVCEIWRRRTGRKQEAVLDVEGAALSLQSVFYQRQGRYPIALGAPDPTVGIYPTCDRRFVAIHGGFPALREGLLNLLGWCRH